MTSSRERFGHVTKTGLESKDIIWFSKDMTVSRVPMRDFEVIKIIQNFCSPEHEDITI
jgi:hypothetical protein